MSVYKLKHTKQLMQLFGRLEEVPTNLKSVYQRDKKNFIILNENDINYFKFVPSLNIIEMSVLQSKCPAFCYSESYPYKQINLSDKSTKRILEYCLDMAIDEDDTIIRQEPFKLTYKVTEDGEMGEVFIEWIKPIELYRITIDINERYTNPIV